MGWFSCSNNNDSDRMLEEELEKLKIREENYNKRRGIEDKLKDLEYEHNSLQRDIDNAWNNLCSVRGDKGDGREQDRWRYEHDKLVSKQDYLSRKKSDLERELWSIPW